MSDPKSFYDRQYQGTSYAQTATSGIDEHRSAIGTMILEYQLANRCCLEIGCGRGAYQDIASNYIGVDLARTTASFMHKPFVCCSAKELPFRANTFDCVWTVNVLEHIPEPEKVLLEIRRVLKPGGLLYLQAAWQCRPWAADGYAVRPYGDFNWKGKAIKATIPLRNSIWFRLLYTLPRRVWRSLPYLINKESFSFKYSKLRPNYDKYWCADSDACNSMDPFDAILWFRFRGDICLSHASFYKSISIRTGRLIFKKGNGSNP